MSKTQIVFFEIGNQLYPVVYDLDEYYGLRSDQALYPPGVIGNRDSRIMRTATIFHGMKLYFKKELLFRESTKTKYKSAVKKNEDNKYVFVKHHSLPIVYYINDHVEISIADFIGSQPSRESYVLISLTNGTTKLELFLRDDTQDYIIQKIAPLSNRYLLVGNERVPIVFDYDYLLNATVANEVKVLNEGKDPAFILTLP